MHIFDAFSSTIFLFLIAYKYRNKMMHLVKTTTVRNKKMGLDSNAKVFLQLMGKTLFESPPELSLFWWDKCAKLHNDEEEMDKLKNLWSVNVF